MIATTLYRTTTNKPVLTFIEDLKHQARRHNLNIGVEETVCSDLSHAKPHTNLNLIQISPRQEPDTDTPFPSLLSAKHLTVFRLNEKTEIRFMSYVPEVITQLFQNDTLPDSLSAGYRQIIDLINASCLEA